jgi:hypothetical protein
MAGVRESERVVDEVATSRKVGRKSRRAEGVHSCFRMSRAGFEPFVRGRAACKHALGRGSNPARVYQSEWQHPRRAEIFALPTRCWYAEGPSFPHACHEQAESASNGSRTFLSS